MATNENNLNLDPDAPQPAAIVLLSGGLDSATVLALALQAGYCVTTLAFDYGQRHRFELAAAQQIAHHAGVREHIVLSIDLRAIGGSALTSDEFTVPKQPNESPQANPEIPVTYVPARNTIFLSCALGLAETRGAYDIFIGVNAVDYSGYPDCRPAFIQAFEKLANLATKAGVEARAATGNDARFRIQTPLIALTKSAIIRRGIDLGVDYSLTTSCYDPQVATGYACGNCDACRLRKQGFAAAGVPDPTRYRGARQQL